MTLRTIVLVALAVGLFGCGAKGKKLPITCVGDCGVVGMVSQTPSPDAGNGGDGAGGAGDQGDGVTLQGDVLVLNDLSSLAATPFLDSAQIRVEGQQTGSVTGAWNGTDAFSIEDVRRGVVVWAEATPLPGDALPTAQPLDTHRPDAQGIVEGPLTLVRTSDIDLAFNVLTLPVARDTSKAQALLIVSRGGAPFPGVTVLATGAEVVIYGDNGGFSDTATTTDRTGVVLLANVPAVGWPGSEITVRLSGALSGEWGVRLVAGAVTFGSVGD